VPSPPIAAQGQRPFGSEFRPTSAAQLYVSNAHDGPNAGSVSAFGVGGEGPLNTYRRLTVPGQPDRAMLGQDQP